MYNTKTNAPRRNQAGPDPLFHSSGENRHLDRWPQGQNSTQRILKVFAVFAGKLFDGCRGN